LPLIRRAAQFFVAKYEAEASKNWDLFYKRNADRFFKDRCGSRAGSLPLLSRARARRARRLSAAAERQSARAGTTWTTSSSSCARHVRRARRPAPGAAAAARRR
jgi:hypothetical protein